MFTRTGYQVTGKQTSFRILVFRKVLLFLLETIVSYKLDIKPHKYNNDILVFMCVCVCECKLVFFYPLLNYLQYFT